MAGGALSTRARRGAIIEGINVTPLVDIMLVLLVVFIVTAKLVVTPPAVTLDLPAASRGEAISSVLTLAISADGSISMGGVAIDEPALAARARAALATQSDTRAIIHADRAVPHGRVVTVLDTLKATGVTRVAFAAQPSEPPPAAPSSGQEL